jgi:prolipoprotein diacylglyceryltransferase
VVFHSELRRSDLSSEGVDAALIGVRGGLVGAKVVWAIEFRDDAPFLSLLFSRGGLSWFGGFLGGVGGGLWALHRRRIPIMAALAAAAPALAIGHAIGRIGCFMVGDDYRRPTDLPWGVAFPEDESAQTADVVQTVRSGDIEIVLRAPAGVFRQGATASSSISDRRSRATCLTRETCGAAQTCPCRAT